MIASFIAEPSFPCVGAKSALNKQRMRFGHYPALCDPSAIAQQCAALQQFSDEFPEPGAIPVSFVATFGEPGAARAAVPSEAEFEALMWRHLQLMHNADSRRFAWNPSVASDPDQKDFSFSIAGRAFFVVGLHPNASRLARRAPLPSLVFNFHDQFTELKASGRYASMQDVIRARDTELQGSVNPVLARFGDASEARQYSGRAVEDDWACPFRPVHSAASAQTALQDGLRKPQAIRQTSRQASRALPPLPVRLRRLAGDR